MVAQVLNLADKTSAEELLALRETGQLNLDKISFAALKFKRQIWAPKRSTDVYKFPPIGLG